MRRALRVESHLRAPRLACSSRVVTRVTLSVDPDLDVAPFQQIAAQLREFVERGDLRPGDTLPTVRQLAGDLGVAPNTVARAYADLQEAGWLHSEGRRGTRVSGKIPSADRRVRTHALTDAVSRFIESLRHRGYSDGEIGAE